MRGMMAAALLVVVVSAGEETKLGSGVTLDPATPIAAIVAAPGDFVGKTVRIDGVATAVCEHMGCWMTLAPAGATGGTPATLRLKVDDGVIVFPVSAKGRTAVAQGVVKAVEAGDHHAADHAGEHAAAKAATRYQLEVTGAVIR